MGLMCEIEAEDPMSILRGTHIDSYEIKGGTSPVSLATVLQALLGKQATAQKMLYGGIDFPNLVIPCDVTLERMTLYDAVKSARDLAINQSYSNFRPQLVFRAEVDSGDSTKWYLWLRVPIQASDSPWPGHGSLGENKGQVLKPNVNVKSLRRTTDYAPLATRLYAFGKEGMALDAPGYVEDTIAIAKWGILEGRFDEQYATTKPQLAWLARIKLQSVKDPVIGYVVDTVDFGDLDTDDLLMLGSLVSVTDVDLGLATVCRVVSIEKRLDDRGSVSLELDNLVTNFADLFLEIWRNLRRHEWGEDVAVGWRQGEYWSETVAQLVVKVGGWPGVRVPVMPSEIMPERMIAVVKYGGVSNTADERNYLTGGYIRVKGYNAIKITSGQLQIQPGGYGSGDFIVGDINLAQYFCAPQTYSFSYSGGVHKTDLILYDVQCGLRFEWP